MLSWLTLNSFLLTSWQSSETKGEEARLIGYLQKGQLLKLTGKEPITEHWTKPPPRFNEVS